MEPFSATIETRNQFSQSAVSCLRRAAERIVCALEDCWITFWPVRLHQQVVCGTLLCKTICVGENGEHWADCIIANDYGVLKPLDGSPIFQHANAAGPEITFVKKGTPLLVITREASGREAGTIKGLTPRPTRVMFLRKQRLLQVYKSS